MLRTFKTFLGSYLLLAKTEMKDKIEKKSFLKQYYAFF